MVAVVAGPGLLRCRPRLLPQLQRPRPTLVSLATPACAGNNCASGNGFITIETLRAMANASLATNGNTPVGHAARTYQECLKNLLDMVNHNGNNGYNCPLTTVIPSAPCSFTSPY